MAFPRFVAVQKEGRAALINIESIQSIEAPRVDYPGVRITITGGKEFLLHINEKDECDCGGKIYAALQKIIGVCCLAEKYPGELHG